MCIGLPLQVQSVEPGHAWVAGRGEHRRVNTALVDGDGPCRPGDWLLVFLDGARERLTPERAAEIAATLDLLGDALAGAQHGGTGEAAFTLPSAMSAEQLAALTTSPAPEPHKETP
jgi:hydrogenase expression/formation protein HypC